MKITDIKLETCILRKEDPTWRFALGSNPTTEGVIVSIETNQDITGFGYGSATAHMGASIEGLTGTLKRLVPYVKEHNPLSMSEIRLTMDRVLFGNNQAKAAIENALFDLAAKSMNVPLHQLFGGAVKTEFPVLRILAIKEPGEMAAQAQILYDQGYRYFKIKVHGEVALDIKRVATIRKQAPLVEADICSCQDSKYTSFFYGGFPEAVPHRVEVLVLDELGPDTPRPA